MFGRLFIILVFILNINHVLRVKCQLRNQLPYFIAGSGDMSRLSLSENTPVDSPVYQLKGIFCSFTPNLIEFLDKSIQIFSIFRFGK